MSKDRILAVMPVHNRINYTINGLSCLVGNKSSSYDLDILVVDDGSTDGTSDKISRDYPDVILEKGNGGLWWSGGVNVGLRHALKHRYDYVYIINDDNVVKDGALDELYRVAKSDSKNICTSLVLNIDGEKILNAGLNYKGPLKKISENMRGQSAQDVERTLAVDLIGSRSTLVPVGCVEQIGLFDVERFPQHYGDLEYFNRARENGYQLLVVPSSIVLTKENKNYLHNYILRSTVKELVRAYGDIRHPFNLRTMFFRCYVGRGKIRGSLLLFRELVVHGGWIFLKIVLPNVMLRGIMASIK